IKALRSNLEQENLLKDSLKEKVYQLEATNLQNEQNEKNMINVFENIASKILKENTVDFAQTNQKEIETMLKPFKENLFEFGQKMEHVKTQNTELKTQIDILKISSATLSEDAKNLTEALRGSSKIQGNWGEILLKRILETSGLEEGMNYTMQDSFSVDGSRYQTDCIVNLAENRNVVIDSKVSLIPLQNFYQANDEETQKECLKELERSIRNHIDTLDKKAYQDIDDIVSPDYVLMFMPVEGAFNLMVSEFDAIMDYAWKKRVLLVSPSTLMIALRTIALFWRQEKQTKNIEEIVRVAGTLYDKFFGFVENMDGISGGVRKIQENLDGAMSKIQGHGGVASQVQRLQDLGAKTKKQIPSELIEVE
ncbi:MAG: DNA recombination protein RmuC, partial [bacterium]